MDGLRWLLLLFGVLIVAGVYFYSRKQRAQSEESGTPPVSPEFSEPIPEVADSGEQVSQERPSVTNGGATEQKIVTLRLVARNNGAINGEELALNLRGIGMRHGKFGIYHHYEAADEDKIVFSAASLVEPGTFDLKNLKDQQIPGISLFMVLPGPVEGALAFDSMVAAARTLSQSLNAELLDETGSTLSIQRERYMREEIIQFEHSHLVA
ncbi:MAG: cell division protein ZipA C-terminal FtsZ-binding domain-containing protein [Woeseiaceae bacterium]|nr:cell division protein ZipA C-terminal FtsZ-binding domain-containing protein [Woeseiaceae bacterium]